MANELWEFWIDVGGTFTDCVARRPDGTLLRHKCLSSGVTKGTVGDGSTRGVISDRRRQRDPAGFWSGSELCLLDAQGQVRERSSVLESDGDQGQLVLASPLAEEPRSGSVYEIHTGVEAPILAIRFLLGLASDAPIPPVRVRLGTTKGTNALLTRRGANVALVTTRGLADVLEIGYQDRPALFDLSIEKPQPLCDAVAEIDERVTADGQSLIAPNREQVTSTLSALRERGVDSLALCLLHADRYPEHEVFVEEIARDLGFAEISRSSQVAPLMKIVSRGDTTVVDAYLNPILRSYLETIQSHLAPQLSELRVLNSAGGLVELHQFHGKDSILSGPAGGVVGASRVAGAAGFDRPICFDMGGTSTDVSRFNGRFDLEYETEKAGVRIVAPLMAIETVAAGGGSVCWFDGTKLAVGPESAGAAPGPACYGAGGPLAVTDLNLVLGRIQPEQFPFGLNKQAVEDRLDELKEQVSEATGKSLSSVELAAGLLAIANQNMAQAIRSISISKGYSPRDYVLVAFGGAAPQHACAVAEQLGMRQILCHPDAGILSAYGVGLADTVRHAVRGVYTNLSELQGDRLAGILDSLIEETRLQVTDQGIPPDRIQTRRTLDMRYAGTDAAINIPWPDDGDLEAAFQHNFRRLYGYLHEGRPLEIVAARAEAIGKSATQPPPSSRSKHKRAAAAHGSAQVFSGGQFHAANLFVRSDLSPGETIQGPAVVLEDTSTTVVDIGWQAELLSGGELLIELAGATGPGRQLHTVEDDPVTLEIFNSHFAGIAEHMGITLRNTASSVNVKERLDFSCAVFTAAGDLVVNAPHIPVHLGAMSETVKQVLADRPQLQAGDVIVTNDPYRGGSHLPDVTVVTPVFDEDHRLLFWTASRAHHAEIGGAAPGSMSPFARCLAEEGVLIRDFQVIAAGRSRFSELADLLATSPFPSRDVKTNLADIEAQIAANQQGASELLRLVADHSWAVVSAQMQHIQRAAERRVRAVLKSIPDGQHGFTDHLDDGSPIAVTITVSDDSAHFDFTGSGPVVPTNYNANRSIVTAAVLYCLRCLIADNIPLNQGVLAPVELTLPPGILNPPAGSTASESPAVSAGNVETSQRVVDVILGALGVAAASQGTMNNVLFGDGNFAYYETICGGTGATPNAKGASAVQSHMTNTRITDPEVLEQRYPVRLLEFSVRRGSGGAGLHTGGDGIIRRLEFLANAELSILSQRRGPYPPYGLSGGAPGDLGYNELRRRDGVQESLPSNVLTTVQVGDVLTIKTPGGGGYGAT